MHPHHAIFFIVKHEGIMFYFIFNAIRKEVFFFRGGII